MCITRILTGKDQPDREHNNALKDAAYNLTMLSLQSIRYTRDPEFTDAVDAVLELSRRVVYLKKDIEIITEDIQP